MPEIDELVREKESIEKILDITDNILLKDYLNLSTQKYELCEIYEKSFPRRMNRKF